MGGLKQEDVKSEKEKVLIDKVLDKTRLHMGELSPELGKNCVNQHERCAFWSSIGECEKNPGYMITSCAPACQTCDQLLYEERCKVDLEKPMVAAYHPGDLTTLFGHLAETYKEYGPVIHSESPFVITFENFLSDEECDALSNYGINHKDGIFKRSTDVGKKLFDGSNEKKVSKTRTSENYWCNSKDCESIPIIQGISERVHRVTESPYNNSEHFQVLKYEVGEFYGKHHDYISNDGLAGPRVMTFLLYLSDVEEGGGTGFPTLKPPLVINPKKGRALLWPSVLENDPMTKDARTMHEALLLGLLLGFIKKCCYLNYYHKG